MEYSTFIKNIEKERNVKIKVKGTDVGKPNVFNKNLLILKKGLINHFVEGKDFLNTIRENQELIDYQIIKKRTAKTKYMNKDTLEILPDKVLRLFPVTKNGICIVNDKFASIPEVPDQVIIVKDNILGYDYILEENGINISGGQRQRIILARSLLKNSKIIMIDEGFNQIDIKLEREILLDIFRYFHDRTFIIISHRIENSDLYNRVIKIDNGFVNMIEEVYNE